jgi:hypothetical protein
VTQHCRSSKWQVLGRRPEGNALILPCPYPLYDVVPSMASQRSLKSPSLTLSTTARLVLQLAPSVTALSRVDMRDLRNLHTPCSRTSFSAVTRQSCQHNPIASLSALYFTIRVPRPMGVRFHQLLERLDIRLPRMNPSRLSRIPRPTYDFRLVRHVRGETSALFRGHFHLSGLCGCLFILTGRFFKGKLDVPPYVKTKFSHTASTPSTACIWPNVTPSTELFR